MRCRTSRLRKSATSPARVATRQVTEGVMNARGAPQEASDDVCGAVVGVARIISHFSTIRARQFKVRGSHPRAFVSFHLNPPSTLQSSRGPGLFFRTERSCLCGALLEPSERSSGTGGRGYGWSLPDGAKPSLDWDKLVAAKNAEARGTPRGTVLWTSEGHTRLVPNSAPTWSSRCFVLPLVISKSASI